jgi:outer membrane protein
MRQGFARLSMLFACAAIAAEVGLPATLLAQDRSRLEWDVTLGAGLGVRPTYEGSDHYIASPVPFAKVIWRDTISLGVDGLSAYWRYQDLRIGGGVTLSPGRVQNSGIFSQGDGRLFGMGDIPAALGLRGFADYKLGFVNLNASVTKFTASGNDGVLVNFGVAVPYRLTENTTITARVSADWADQSYMQTYFGVTPAQSASSGFAQFNAGAGIKDVGLALGVNHHFGRNWMLAVDARFTRLTGDAENSPIVFSKTATTFMSAIAYHF